MFQDRLNNISEFIKQHNKYFNTGYADVHMDETKGYISSGNIVFPADNLGDYFYLRLPKNVQFAYSNENKISDCVDGIASVTQVILVAAVKDADADTLIGNLIVTLRNYREAKIRIISGIYQPENVVLQEMAKISKENQEAALQRLPQNTAFVSITFELTEVITDYKLKCIANPCKC